MTEQPGFPDAGAHTYPPPAGASVPYPAPAAYPGTPAAGGPRGATRWTAGASRSLRTPVGSVRTPVLQAIRAMGFETTSEQYSSIRAERGSKLFGLSLTRTRVPTELEVALTPLGDGSRVEITVEDRWPAPVRPAPAAAVYAEVFTEVLTRLDEALKGCDPSAELSPWWRQLPEEEVTAGEAGAGTAARWDHALQKRASRLLDGSRGSPNAASADAGVEAVVFRSPGATARVATEVFDGMLTAGQLVAGAPGSMPRPLVEQVQAMVVLLEEQLAHATQGGMRGELDVTVPAADKPVITFLYQQSALREKLPVRLLMTCTTCRLEKIVNPDYARLQERSRRVKVLSTSVGAVLGTHHVSPYVLVGRLAQLKKSDPDFVCARCQGTDADQKPITFCPRCGDRRDESALTTCSKCKLDLRSSLPKQPVWNAIEASPAASAVAVPAVPSPVATAEPVAAEWFPDPLHRFEYRYWDGTQWTAHVASHGAVSSDPPTP